MTFSPFQEFLPKAINQHGLQKTVVAIGVCDTFTNLKQSIFPEDAENRLTAKNFKDGTLTIGVPDSVWAHEVIHRKDKIIQDVNTKYADQVIKKIRTEVTAPITSIDPPAPTDSVDTQDRSAA